MSPEDYKRTRGGDIYGRIEHQADCDQYYGNTVANHWLLNTSFDHETDKTSEFKAAHQHY